MCDVMNEPYLPRVILTVNSPVVTQYNTAFENHDIRQPPSPPSLVAEATYHNNNPQKRSLSLSCAKAEEKQSEIEPLHVSWGSKNDVINTESQCRTFPELWNLQNHMPHFHLGAFKEVFQVGGSFFIFPTRNGMTLKTLIAVVQWRERCPML